LLRERRATFFIPEVALIAFIAFIGEHLIF
jgi:hypothetical protein